MKWPGKKKQDAQAAPTAEAVPAKEPLFLHLRNRLSKARKNLADRIEQLFEGKKAMDRDLLEELEEVLITADVGVPFTMHLTRGLSEKLNKKDLVDAAQLKGLVHDQILDCLSSCTGNRQQPASKPCVIMVVGVNGVGKTTTIGKLAARYRGEDKEVLVVAADTFRAAAVEQLEIWTERAGAQIVRHRGTADPAAVVYDGLQAAAARGTDVVIIDTAGRIHTRKNLMEELGKIKRTAAAQCPGAPHEVWLVIDATTGHNALSQARLFHEAVGLTGIVLAKLDGTAKGGIVIAICHELGIPLRYVGLGEKLDDLQQFDPEAFVDALF